MIITCLTLSVCLAPASRLQAEGFAIFDQGARGTAMSGAVLAGKPSGESLSGNPALLALIEEDSVSAGFTIIATSGAIDWNDGGVSGRTESKKSQYFIPHAYFNHRLNDSLVLGVGQFSRFGLGNTYWDEWPGRFNVYDVYLLTSSLNVALAYKATEKLSVAAGIELMYAALSMKNRTLMPVPAVGIGDVDASIEKAKDIAFGFNLSGHYRFTPEWAAGLVYRAPVRLKASGPMRFRYIGPDDQNLLAAFQQTFHDGDVSGTITLPESIALGIAYTPSERLTVETSFMWTRWSRYRSLDMRLPGGLGELVSPKNWRDTWRLAVGAEYTVFEGLDLRAGYSYIQSPMTARDADYTVPTADRHTFTLGAGYRTGSIGVDLAYSYVDCLDRTFRSSPLADGGNGTVDSKSSGFNAHELSATVSYYF
jgi:long-chain fatty acid transport protein